MKVAGLTALNADGGPATPAAQTCPHLTSLLLAVRNKCDGHQTCRLKPSEIGVEKNQCPGVSSVNFRVNCIKPGDIGYMYRQRPLEMSMAAIFHPTRPFSSIHATPIFPHPFLLLSLFLLFLFTFSSSLRLLFLPYSYPSPASFTHFPHKSSSWAGENCKRSRQTLVGGGKNNFVAPQVFGFGGDRPYGVGAYAQISQTDPRDGLLYTEV